MKKFLTWDLFFIVVLIFFAFAAEPIITLFPRTQISDAQNLNGDLTTFLWNIWYFNKALSSPNLDIFYSDYMFYPLGVNLHFIPYVPLNSFLTSFLYPWLGVVGCHNASILLSYILSAIGMFLLAKYLCQNSFAAFIAGFYYAFSDYHICKTSTHIEHACIQWIPFYALFFLKAIHNNYSNRKNALWAGFFLSLNAYTNYYYLLYCILFSIFYLMYIFICNLYNTPNTTNFWTKIRDTLYQIPSSKKRCLLFLCLSFLLLTLPLSIPIGINQFGDNPNLMTVQNRPDFAKKDAAKEYYAYHADILDYVAPVEIAELIAPFYLGKDSVVFLRFFGLILLCIAIIKHKVILNSHVWLITALFFLLLSFGGVFYFCGHILFPLPFFPWLTSLFLFDGMRTPIRFGIMVIFCVSIIISLLIAYSAKNSSKFIIHLIALALVFEFFLMRGPNDNTKDVLIPQALQFVKNSPQSAILEIPLGWETEKWGGLGIVDNRIGKLYQTYHEKKTLGGQYDRIPKNACEYLLDKPLVKDILVLQKGNPKVTNKNSKENMQLLSFLDIGNIVLYKSFFSKTIQKNITHYIKNYTNCKMIYESKNISIFRIQKFPIINKLNLNGPQSPMIFSGFQPKVHTKNKDKFISTNFHKSVLLFHNKNAHKLKITRRAISSSTREKIYINGHKISDTTIDKRWTTSFINLSNKKEGINKLVLYHTGLDIRSFSIQAKK